MNRDFTIKTPLTAKVANPTSVRELQTQNAADGWRRWFRILDPNYRGASSSNPCSNFSWHSIQCRVQGTASRRLALISLPQ
jgi:hypothetical protein